MCERMSEKDMQRLKYYEKLVKAGAKAPAGKEPSSCAKCPYFQPDFRFRKCLYTRCPFGRKVKIFRERPLGREKVARMEEQDAVKADG